MNIPKLLLNITLCSLLLGCDSGLGQSDMLGVFTTDHGDCVKEGDVGITIDDNKVHVVYYCFLAKCNHMEGTINEGGHFYLSDRQGHYVQGQILNQKASGSWFATIGEKKCSGTWFAKPRAK